MKVFIIAALGLIAIGTAAAQDEPEWPLDPSTIFAPGVEIISAEHKELPPNPIFATETPLPPNRCGGGVPQQWKAWVFDSFENPAHLCNTRTGALSPPLPAGYTWNTPNDPSLWRSETSTSPDGKWVVFLGQKGEDYGHPAILVYDGDAQTFHVLGSFERQPNFRFGEWINNQILLLDTYNMGNVNYYDHFMYVIDLRYQTITRHGIVYDDAITYYPDPPRLITRTGSSNNLHCTETIYFIESRLIEEHDYGAFCQMEYRNVTTDAAYYRLLTPDGRADVVRYDRETGEQATIFHGGIEHVNWVSPDEHLAWLTLNDKGGVFVSPMTGSRSMDFYQAHLALVDLTTGKTFYQIPAQWNGWAGYWSPTVRAYLDNWFFIDTRMGEAGSNRLIQLEDSGVATEHMVDGNLTPPLGDGWAFMKKSVEKDWKVDFYNLDTGQIVRLVETPTQYYVVVEHRHDDVFRVTVAPLYYLDTRRTIYEVQVPGVDISEAA